MVSDPDSRQQPVSYFGGAVGEGDQTQTPQGQSFVFGAVALLTILTAHGVVRIARFQPGLAKMFDHRIRVLVHDGQIRKDQLRLAPDRCRCGTMATFFMARPLLDPVVRGA